MGRSFITLPYEWQPLHQGSFSHLKGKLNCLLRDLSSHFHSCGGKEVVVAALLVRVRSNGDQEGSLDVGAHRAHV